jgi:hypothetical protein
MSSGKVQDWGQDTEALGAGGHIAQYMLTLDW